MRTVDSPARRWLPRTAALALLAVPVFGVVSPASAAPPTNVPTITVTASPSVAVQNNIYAGADLENGINTPDAILTFRLYGPNDASCAGTPISSTVETSGNGPYQSAFTYAQAAGTYRWTVSFAGDASNQPVTTPCNAPTSTTDVTKASPVISDTASASVPLGGQIYDNATLTGTSIPTGTVDFALYGPDNATCADAPITTLQSDVGSRTTYQSASYTPTTPGVYHWIASYPGDANNGMAATACTDDGASVIVQGATATASITLSQDELQYGAEQVETVTASVTTSATGPTPTGSITIQDGSLEICTIAVVPASAGTSGGSCTFVKTQLDPNSYLLAASYPGDDNVGATLSASTALEVTKQPSAVTLHLAHSSAKYGKEAKEHFSVTATTSPGGQPVKGKVAIKVGHRTLCTATLHGDGKGSCSLSHKQLGPGKYAVTAHYLATGQVTSATSKPKTLHITG